MKQNLQKFYKENKNILGLLCLFIIIQPFLDTREFFTNKNLEIFGMTIPTIVRCLFISVIAIIFLKNHRNKMHDSFMVGYLIILIIYFVFHHIIVKDNSMAIPSNYLYSIKAELFYIIRMILPLAIIFFTRYSNIKYEKFIKPILISSLIIGLVIFIGNTLCISYTSYVSDKDITLANWISWFIPSSNTYTFSELTSKGWFYMANQVSGLMMLLIPFCIYDLLKKRNWLNITATLLLIISMIMVGSRTAAYGWILTASCFILVLLYLRFSKKEEWWSFKRIYPLFIIVFIGISFLIVSPINTRDYGYTLGDIDKLEKPPTDLTKKNYQQLYSYILKSYDVYRIQKVYIMDLYNYKYDPRFWLDVFEKSKKGVIENREMQRLISTQIAKLNNNSIKYKLFGYSFSRMRSGEIYMEHDFIVQAFTMGYIGLVLLLGPYIGIMILVIIKILKKLKKQPKLIDFSFIISIGAVLGTSILTGHILDELFVTIYIGFICGFFLKRTSTSEVFIDEANKS